ncbi:hypothetical protein Y032_0268g784 [Ancylostoma ceylanicum]|nr:hypothetical protein Y032_0268g784 [Ancylostoma ceylanicum]
MRIRPPPNIPPRVDPPLTLEERIAEIKERFRAKARDLAEMEDRYDEEITNQCNTISEETMQLAASPNAEIFHRVYTRFHYIALLKEVRAKLRRLKSYSQSLANQLEL